MPVVNGIAHTEDNAEVWLKYKKTGSIVYRNMLIDCYLDRTKQFAGKIYASRIGNIADFNDYLHFGVLGLISSIEKYDPTYGAQFFTYASYRIRGSIIDGIASMEEKTSSVQNELIFKNRFVSIHDHKDDDDLFEKLVDTSVLLAIGFMLEDENEASDQYCNHAFQELKEVLSNYVDLLNDNEKTVIEYHYFHQVPFVTIAEILNLTKSRVAQIHKKALLVLREKYTNTLELEL